MITSNKRRRLLQVGASLSLAPWVGVLKAQDKYPSKPIRVILGLPPGGVVDNSMRALAAVLQPRLGQTLIIDNKPGGTFAIAMQALSMAPADGYTLLHITTTALTGQAVQKRFDIFKQLQPIALLGSSDIAYAVGAKSPHKTMQDLINWGKANPRKLSYGTPGIGSIEHLGVSAFCRKVGIEAVHIPFKGSPDVMQATATGEIDFGTMAVPFIAQFGPKGLVRSLMVAAHKRNPILPDVPSMDDLKLDTPRMNTWGGLAAPTGTPKSVIDYLETQILESMKSPELLKQYASMGLAATPQGATAFGKEWAEDWAWISKAAQETQLD